MPIKRTDKGWYWGSKGPFKSKRKAQKVAQASYASEYQKSFQKGNLTKLLESVLYDLRKESSSTVFMSTNSGIFTPTYGSSKSTRKRKKKIDDKKRGQGLISATKKSGVEKLQRWMSDKSPVKKIKKDIKKYIETNTGSEVHNPKILDWKKYPEENDDPKFVEREGKDEKEQDLSVIEQNDFQRKVTEMDEDNKRKTRGRDTTELDGEVSAAAGVVQLSKQPNKFGNPQDDELLRGSKKDKSKKDGVVDFELTKNTTLQKMDRVIELNETEDIDILTAISKVFLEDEE